LSEGRIPRRGESCPICGRPIDWVERRVVNGHVYYYAWHVIEENGRGGGGSATLAPRFTTT